MYIHVHVYTHEAYKCIYTCTLFQPYHPRQGDREHSTQWGILIAKKTAGIKTTVNHIQCTVWNNGGLTEVCVGASKKFAKLL